MQTLAANANENNPSSGMGMFNLDGQSYSEKELDFDEFSAINSRRDKGYSFAGASENDFTGGEGDGGNRDNIGERDYDLDELADVLGI